MVISTYDNTYNGMEHWATAFYTQDEHLRPTRAVPAEASEAGATALKLSDLPAGIRRRAEMVARDHVAIVTNCRQSAVPRQRRARSAGPAGRRKAAARGASCNTYSPFASREPPRGKFSSFPAAITRVLPRSPDPLGYTPYGPSTATGLEGYTAEDAPRQKSRPPVEVQGVVPHEEGQQGTRGRASRYPFGGYPTDVVKSPMLHSISATEDSPASWRRYEELEGQPRGRASRYPKPLDPYPAYRK
eukprot:gb/GFBE01013119.1/.p1 GENE.gb/GFBE01013119.1/~~gb/GFBE01013119.1/.p1  ORF type:complete len:245 (+),score=13.37 gb/GFBE01013119.1/:1-735(+)